MALDEVAPRWELLQRERDTLQTLIAELAVAENERAARERDIARIDREFAEVTAARDELTRIAAESRTGLRPGTCVSWSPPAHSGWALTFRTSAR